MSPQQYTFLINTNLGLAPNSIPFSSFNLTSSATTDLPFIGRQLSQHIPDFAFIPSADLHRLLCRGNRMYRGIAIQTSKFTGQTKSPSILVVKKNDPAKGVLDVKAAGFGCINESCSSSYFAAAVMSAKHGEILHDFFDAKRVKACQARSTLFCAGKSDAPSYQRTAVFNAV